MRKDSTPEEKLLRLIKGKRPSSESNESIKTPLPNAREETPVRREEPADDRLMRQTDERGERFASRGARLAADRPQEDRKGKFIRLLPVLLILLLTGVVFYLVADMFFVTPYFRHKIEAVSIKTEPPEAKVVEREVLPEAKIEQEPTKPYSYYSKDIGQRDIFKPVVEVRKGGADSGIKGIRENFSLIGVIAGEKLQAAIEDKKGNQTYFVYKGDYIDDILVEDILVNKVILEYRGERFELML